MNTTQESSYPLQAPGPYDRRRLSGPPRYRFYCPDLVLPTLSAKRIHLDPDQARHARRVLRMGIGDPVELFNGQGDIADARLGEDDHVQVERVRHTARPSPVIDLAVSFPKAGRGDGMTHALVQLGADALIPLLTEHSVVDPRPQKLHRLQKAAIESAKQCGRAYLMRIAPVTLLRDVLRRHYDLRLMADTIAGDCPADVDPMLADAKNVLILIGPEGGWTDAERNLAREHGCIAWQLGPHVLRIETAAAAAIAIARRGT